MGKERGDKKGKRHTKSSGNVRNQMNFGKTESPEQCQAPGRRKNEKGGGGGASGENISERGNGWCSANFF